MSDMQITVYLLYKPDEIGVVITEFNEIQDFKVKLLSGIGVSAYNMEF